MSSPSHDPPVSRRRRRVKWYKKPRIIRASIAFVCGILIVVVASVLFKNQNTQNVEAPIVDTIKIVQGDDLPGVKGVKYDLSIENSSKELGKSESDRFTPLSGKNFLLFRLNKPLSPSSQAKLQEAIMQHRYVTRCVVKEFGIAIEKIGDHTDDARDPKKILYPWDKIRDYVLPLLIRELQP